VKGTPVLAWALSAALAACAPGGAPPPAAPAPVVRESAAPGLHVRVEERFYPVSGASASSLNRSLAVQGSRSLGRPAHALTEWRLDWSWAPVGRGAACESGRADVRVEIVTTFPTWTDVDRANASLSSDWALFLDRLRIHESMHREIALRSGLELLETLTSLKGEDCQRLREEARRRAARLESTHEARQRRFDRASDYGMEPGLR
jgi:predicted secreted Zn-dependent protease